MTTMDPKARYVPVPGTFYSYDGRLDPGLAELHQRVAQLRAEGRLSRPALKQLLRFFRIKDIYNSNAIEGNALDIGETRLVVEQGLTITGKPLRDSLEAKNLAHALDYFEELATHTDHPIRGIDVRNIHAAILKGIDDTNAGALRRTNVEISGSSYKPPLHESVGPLMEEFEAWLEASTAPGVNSSNPLVLASAAHTWLVYIHPFVDGNGRTARILMNLVLMRSGYPIAIITKDDRERYYDALEASQTSDLTGVVGLVQESVTESLQEWQYAVDQQKQQEEWAKAIIGTIGEREETRARNDYEVWRAAMELLKGYFKQTVDLLADEASRTGLVRIWFKDFGELEFEKFSSLRRRISVKQTWFFRIDFRSGPKSARYLFFFGYEPQPIRNAIGRPAVTLHVAKETEPFHYERVDNLDTVVPDLVEVAYEPEEERFMWRSRDDALEYGRAEDFVRKFVAQVSGREF